ncbi:hypothetical protein HPP92_012911 [Vanilla planifolia]|uniref:Uncharacterized protein n=1 Tax=Vanilla planifolia TaxID=51239 RepID=A0A835UY01_VANPL|nr:hypothetical protein HPP92_012911 [Vanilla planifolia]
MKPMVYIYRERWIDETPPANSSLFLSSSIRRAAKPIKIDQDVSVAGYDGHAKHPDNQRVLPASNFASEKHPINPFPRTGKSRVKHLLCAASYPSSGDVASENTVISSGYGQLSQQPYSILSNHKPHNSFPPDFVLVQPALHFRWKEPQKTEEEDPAFGIPSANNLKVKQSRYKYKVAGGATGEPGAGSYYRYKEDVKLLSDIGLQAYRFSISWSRVLPKGRGTPNRQGLQYYHKLIDELRSHDIEPFVTIFHWDVPQALEDEYGGFLSRKIVDDYVNYANLLFTEFGGKLPRWRLYKEPYKVAHNILLAHAEAVSLYKNSFQAKDKGQIGITLVSQWFEPYDNQIATHEAQKRALEFNLGWFLDPLKFGNYPFSMRSLVRDRLPIFTEEESNKLKDSFDFIGLNYYTSAYVKDRPYNYTDEPTTCYDDPQIDITPLRGGVPIGPHERDSWVYVYPKGLKKLLLYIKEKYNNPSIYITENGVLEYNKDHHFMPEATQGANPIPSTPIDDIFRMEYHSSHLHELEDALSSRADVKDTSFGRCWTASNGFLATLADLASLTSTTPPTPITRT